MFYSGQQFNGTPPHVASLQPYAAMWTEFTVGDVNEWPRSELVS